MLFNSFDFMVFMPVVFLLYWLIFNKRSVRTRNLFILLASYTFYSFWDWRFTFLLIFSSAMDFVLGRQIFRTPDTEHSKRRMWLIFSVVINLGILGFFKYFNFFVESFVSVFALFGTHLNYQSLQIILPVGVSFYTFQSLSYIFDIYRKKLNPSQTRLPLWLT